MRGILLLVVNLIFTDIHKEQVMSNTESPETTTPEIVPLTEEEIAQQAAAEALTEEKQKTLATLKALADQALAAEALRAEALKAEELAAEALKAEALKAEALRAEALKAEELAAEALRAEELAAEALRAKALAAKKKALADGIAAGKPVKIEVNCETGEEIISLLTKEEVSAREIDAARNLAERLVTEAKKAQEEEERQSLLAWINSQSTLPQAAKNALARAAGIDTTTSSAL